MPTETHRDKGGTEAEACSHKKLANPVGGMEMPVRTLWTRRDGLRSKFVSWVSVLHRLTSS
jgi:hypothetical protein